MFGKHAEKARVINKERTRCNMGPPAGFEQMMITHMTPLLS